MRIWGPIIMNIAVDGDPGPLWKAARRFLTFAAVFSLIDLGYLFLFQSHSYPNYLVWYTGIAAICGLSFPVISRATEDRFNLAKVTTYFSAETWCTIAVFIAFLNLYSVTGFVVASPYNAHVLQANAFLHGHTYIDPAPGTIEHLDYMGHSYQLHPPLPAFIIMPFALFWGLNTNQTLFELIGAAIDAALAFQLLGRMNLSLPTRCWMTIFFGAGTTVWFEAINSGSWDLTMIVALGFTLAAMSELFGQARPWIIGFLAGLAALARYDLALDFPVYILLVYLRRRNWREVAWMAPGFIFVGIIYVTLNEIRFSSLFDIALILWVGKHQQAFALKWFVYDFFTLVFMPPNQTPDFPFFHPGSPGMALTFTAPAFILAFRPSIRDHTTQLMAAGALLAMGPSLFYFSNGAGQFGARHFVHAYPFLFVLVALGIPRSGIDQLTKVLIILSVISNSFFIWHIRIWGI